MRFPAASLANEIFVRSDAAIGAVFAGILGESRAGSGVEAGQLLRAVCISQPIILRHG